MEGSEENRLRLLGRLLRATGAGSVGIALAASCGGATRTSDSRAEHGPSSGGSGDAGADHDASGSGGVPGSGGGILFGSGGAGGSASDGAGGGLTFSDAGGGPDNPIVSTLCVSVDAGDACAPASAIEFPPIDPVEACGGGGDLQSETVLGPTVWNDQCCYGLQVSCFIYVGRAFLVDDHLVKAEMRRGSGWVSGPAPAVEGLSAATRRALRDAWVKDGLFEHASVATFARFAVQLLAAGAPAELLDATLAAGRDEIRHAELCFALASAYAGEPLEPAGLPVPRELPVATDLVGIVEETVVEGCIGETLAAMQAAEQLRRTQDPAVIEALEATIEDESRHAELAWRVVAWALRVGGEPVRRAVEATFTAFEPPPAPVLDLTDVDLAAFEAHGRLSPREARAVALEAIERVVRPAAAALLGRDVLPRRRTLPVAVTA